MNAAQLATQHSKTKKANMIQIKVAIKATIKQKNRIVFWEGEYKKQAKKSRVKIPGKELYRKGKTYFQ